MKDEKKMNDIKYDPRELGYKMGSLFVTVISASGCAIIAAVAIRLIRWLLF